MPMTYPYYDPNWALSTAMSLYLDSGYVPVGQPVEQRNRHIATCKMCGVSSMIPKDADKIMALVCPQCGGPLDA